MRVIEFDLLGMEEYREPSQDEMDWQNEQMIQEAESDYEASIESYELSIFLSEEAY